MMDYLKDRFNCRIQLTGDIGDELLFKHLILTEEDINFLNLFGIDYSTLLKILEIDFISVERFGSFDFLHVTHPDNLTNIQIEGLKISPTISDLGVGIYVISTVDLDALICLEDYISEHYNYDDEILQVTGWYHGPYTICVAGYGHVGYIVINKNISCTALTDFNIISVEDFLVS